MTDTNPADEVVIAVVQKHDKPESAGRILRSAREAAGLHVAALAVAMKVPVKKLEALEADRLDLLPDAVFVRALASSVCRNLKIDPGPVLALLPHHGKPRLGDADRSINTPFHRAGDGRAWTLPGVLKQPALVLTLLLVVAALALWTLPEWHAESVQQTERLADDLVLSQGSASAMPTIVPAADVPATAVTVDAAPAPESAASEAIGLPSAVVALPDATPKPTGDSVLSLTARGPSWVEVTDAKGQVLVRRNLAEGESVGPNGQLPLTVVIGRADMTDVAVRGKPLDLARVARDNVARFEVK
jgi:cytoskeleton protein RodZ